MHNAKIEIRSRDIDNIPDIGQTLKPQHLYILRTNSAGQETIIRGGPETNDKLGIFVDSLQIIKASFDKTNIDWDSEGIHLRQILAQGTDAEMEALVDKMWEKAKEINGHLYDYKLPTVGHVQNSNTAVKVMVEAAGLQLKLPTHKDGSKVWAPGVDSEGFKHTVVDQGLNNLGEWLNQFSSSHTKSGSTHPNTQLPQPTITPPSPPPAAPTPSSSSKPSSPTTNTGKGFWDFSMDDYLPSQFKPINPYKKMWDTYKPAYMDKPLYELPKITMPFYDYTQSYQMFNNNKGIYNDLYKSASKNTMPFTDYSKNYQMFNKDKKTPEEIRLEIWKAEYHIRREIESCGDGTGYCANSIQEIVNKWGVGFSAELASYARSVFHDTLTKSNLGHWSSGIKSELGYAVSHEYNM